MCTVLLCQKTCPSSHQQWSLIPHTSQRERCYLFIYLFEIKSVIYRSCLSLYYWFCSCFHCCQLLPSSRKALISLLGTIFSNYLLLALLFHQLYYPLFLVVFLCFSFLILCVTQFSTSYVYLSVTNSINAHLHNCLCTLATLQRGCRRAKHCDSDTVVDFDTLWAGKNKILPIYCACWHFYEEKLQHLQFPLHVGHYGTLEDIWAKGFYALWASSFIIHCLYFIAFKLQELREDKQHERAIR